MFNTIISLASLPLINAYFVIIVVPASLSYCFSTFLPCFYQLWFIESYTDGMIAKKFGTTRKEVKRKRKELKYHLTKNKNLYFYIPMYPEMTKIKEAHSSSVLPLGGERKTLCRNVLYM